MKLTLTVALGAIVASLGAFQMAAPPSEATPYVNAAIVAVGAGIAYLHGQGVDGAPSPPEQAPPPG